MTDMWLSFPLVSVCSMGLAHMFLQSLPQASLGGHSVLHAFSLFFLTPSIPDFPKKESISYSLVNSYVRTVSLASSKSFPLLQFLLFLQREGRHCRVFWVLSE